MHFSIYNICPERDENNFAYKDYNDVRELLNGEKFPSEIYHRVYTATISDIKDLEDVYFRFNQDQLPDGFKGHSMSVSDIIVVHDSTVANPGCYYCDTWGFKKLYDFDLSKAIDPVSRIQVVRVKPRQYAEITEIDASLLSYQREVGGFIEIYYPFEDPNTCIVCNDEGKIAGLPYNRGIRNIETGCTEDIIAGTFFIADCSQEELGSLDPERLEKYQKMFYKPEHFLMFDGRIHSLPYAPLVEKVQEMAEER